ncbi:hypothetical protein L211DRAFT_809447 [Terfezia boudieri ATCC MYA-4762]|uniref:Proteasome activator subunit 4 n=1 Tax=Terfezia boudieri ATCC MYA-4762 TaxID=1051890 RepID=A0A3N4LRM0_9PEZI|nr:hypothetical protein L211DRAFT_809447 [Terfezia boudieri ATCC MYA-4762]
MSKSFADFRLTHLSSDSHDQASGATTPGGVDWSNEDDSERNKRHKPRTYPYFQYLPYPVEDEARRLAALDEILKNLYISIEAGDFAPGAVHWTRELRAWLSLKFDLPRATRVKLVKLYYELSLAPGVDPNVSERFASLYSVLMKRKHYLRPGKDLILDWRIMFKELKAYVVPQETGFIHTTTLKRNVRTLNKMCSFAQLYYDPEELPAMFEEFMPYFSTSFVEGAFVVVGLFNLLLPTTPPPPNRPNLTPSYYLPTLFHLWHLVNRSKTFDISFLDYFSRLSRDLLPASHIGFGPHGIFTKDQSDLIFTAILRLLEIPVGMSNSPYSHVVDSSAGLAHPLERDQRKHPFIHSIGRWIVMSLSGKAADHDDSTMHGLEGLIEAVETFFHPSNSGNWSRTLSQLVFYLTDFFLMRWNKEQNGEMEVPEDRRLTPELKRRFVLCLKEVTFMGIYSKSENAMTFSLSALQGLANLEPELILPGALQRIYPSMQGLVEVHRTTSSLRSLGVLAKVLVRTKGFRCHVTTLMGLALPGIDANDLDKTVNSLHFIQALAYNIPFYGLDQTTNREGSGSHVALEWISQEVDRLEREGAEVAIDYSKELTADLEEEILRSSTTAFGDFVIAFLGRVFTLLENLPDTSRARGQSPEETVVNTLPGVFTPLLAALSPELYDIALVKIVDFVENHVENAARDAMSFICNSLCKVNPKKALKKLIPVLISNIRTEIDENGAASTRHSGPEILPRDRGLVWHLSILCMSIVHAGKAVMNHRQELLKLAEYLHRTCKGLPTVHISNFIHHLLINLTGIYPTDYSLTQPDESVDIDTWGKEYDPKKLTIRWHVPTREEIEFAVELFQTRSEGAMSAIGSLTSDSSPIKRDGTGKDWSDEMTRNLTLLRLIVSGVSMLFDTERVSSGNCIPDTSRDKQGDDAEMRDIDDEFAHPIKEELGEAADEEVQPTRKYPAGYHFQDKTDPLYILIHDLREKIGETLHQAHSFLQSSQQDDVQCFNALYTAYKSWFLDAGTERSAQVLDRVTRVFAADIHPFKVSGLRKKYPRPLLLRRAHVYHLQRMRHNAGPRPLSAMDAILLADLAESCVSLYTDIRRHAQSATDAAVRVIIGARPLVIPSLLDAFEKAIVENDYPRMKGAMYSLLYGSMSKTAGRDWRFAPRLIKAFIAASTADKPSVQKLATGTTYAVMEFGKPVEKMVVLNEDNVRSIKPKEDLLAMIAKKRARILNKRKKIEGKKTQLTLELVELAENSHWKTESRTATLLINLGLRFETIAPDSLIELITRGTIDPHPGLRGLYSGAMIALFCLIELRATCGHDYKKFLLDIVENPTKVVVPTRRDDPNWTEEFLASFANPITPYYVDQDYHGWLVWEKEMIGFLANAEEDIHYDEVEQKARMQIANCLTVEWFEKAFDFMKQEPRDTGADRFRVATAMLLQFTFNLVRDGLTPATFEDLKRLTSEVYDDGSDKHQHRATSEILGGIVCAWRDGPAKRKDQMWEFVFPIMKKVFEDGLNPENLNYWTSFLHLILQGKDPRRSWPVVEYLVSLRLDMTSNAAFKESSKIQLLHNCILETGWHFPFDKPIIDDFMKHLDHPYKGVREAMGQTIASIFRSKYHESYKDVKALMGDQQKASSVGTIPYQPSPDFSALIKDVFQRLEKWRHERPPGQQSQSSYTAGSKTVLLWLDTSLTSYECTTLLPFFPDLFMSEFLHMMDVKEDPELMTLAYHVFRHLPNIPHPPGQDKDFVKSLIRIGKTAISWHQRLRIQINIQVIYFRRLFLISQEQQQALFNCVSEMLEDTQLEVRLGAATSLSGMIRCSPVRIRDRIVEYLKEKFTRMLNENRLPRKTGFGTPSPDYTRITIVRHAAVLGLGALVQAFPYQSPPPKWLPEVLATLAVKAASDPGMVGKSVKTALSEFKKTRQDTWHVDMKAFTPDQLEDLEGVLWKSYFA